MMMPLGHHSSLFFPFWVLLIERKEDASEEVRWMREVCHSMASTEVPIEIQERLLLEKANRYGRSRFNAS
ncbi:MAG: hypothetical protein KJ050_04900 [Candidatus Omnitrophica bacterium]|nr:hypothetical protein [bacterium]MBW7938014.1 hypothetical protein [Candidatus Omnitrophota bacterium]MBV6480551.1 hypothetical protein [bacterium]MCC6733078.1 hypothetical protein [Candidatus Omnitrophota bacterium]MCK6494819.1 hypothetical protein [bacterium]